MYLCMCCLFSIENLKTIQTMVITNETGIHIIHKRKKQKMKLSAAFKDGSSPRFLIFSLLKLWYSEVAT